MGIQRRQLGFVGGQNGVGNPYEVDRRSLSGLASPRFARILRSAYSGLHYLAVPLLLLQLLVSARRHSGYLYRIRERFGLVSCHLKGRQCLWIHAVSMSQVQAALPLVRELRACYPHRPILLTTNTPTGADTVRHLLGGSVEHMYLPWDLPGAVTRFITNVLPSAALILESKLRPNLFHACSRRGIPLLVVSAGVPAGSVRRYGWIHPLICQTLNQPRRILARSREDMMRLLALGASAERMRVAGDIRFDYSAPMSQLEAGQALRRSVDGRNVWVAACTHAGEESLILDVHRQLRQLQPDLLLVLVPRYPGRSERITELCAARSLQLIRRSTGQWVKPETAVLLGDTMGELPLFYAMSDVALIGGSLVPVGGHDPVQAASQGIPMVIGPHTFRIMDTLGLFLEAEAITQVIDEEGLTDALIRLFRDPELRQQQGERARELVMAGRGVTTTVVAELNESIESCR